jgi:hypothetical protein
MRLRRRAADSLQVEELLRELSAHVPAPREEELRELARSAAAAPRSLPSRRRPRPAARWAVGAAAAALLVGASGFGLGTWSTPSGTASTPEVGVGFLPAKGWTVVQAGSLQSGAATAIAANVPLDPADDLRRAALATLATLPARGVVIATTFSLRGDQAADAAFPQRALPLRIAAAQRQPAGLDLHALGTYRLRAGVERYNVDARIYFGTRSPSSAQLAVAQSQLNRLVVAAEQVTLVARPTIHNRNQPITLLGSVESGKANEDVFIEAKECGATEFHEVGGAHTIAGGGWTTTYDPYITTTFRAVWKGSRSATVTVRDRAWVQLQRLQRPARGYDFEVAVRAYRLQFWKRHAVVQRFDRRLGRWIDLKSAVLTDTGGMGNFVWSYGEFSVVVPKGTRIRAVFPLSQARPCYMAGYSNQLTT